MTLQNARAGAATRGAPAFLFAPDLCTGCEACRVACGNENNGGRDTGWRQVLTFNPERHPALPTLHLSLACNHCEVPACAKGCPAHAYRRDGVTGAMLIDADKCIGCRYCSWVCPYDAPQFDEQAGVMTKCTFCAHRLEAGAAPACVAACPTGALMLGERPTYGNEPAFHGLGTWGLGPALTVVRAQRDAPPAGTPPPADDDGPMSFPQRKSKITLGSEKSLVAFTLLLPALAAWFAGGLRVPERAPGLGPFLGIAALAFALSAAHLGRPARAWRAILGLRTSWLSREVAAAGAFTALAALALARPAAPPALILAAFTAALLLVTAMDAVYLAIPRATGPRVHGAESSTTFLLLAGIAGDLPALAAAAAAVQIALTVRTWSKGASAGSRWLGASAIALVLAAVTASVRGAPWTAAFALGLASAAFNRSAFYAALEPSTPASRMQAEERASLSTTEA